MGFRAVGDNYAVVLDSEKGNMFDIRCDTLVSDAVSVTKRGKHTAA